MAIDLKEIIWPQLGAAIDMLENAIVACPDEVWGERKHASDFWYIAFHTLFWLDFDFTPSPEEFVPQLPFGREELDPEGALPPRTYTKTELLTYLDHGRKKSFERIQALSDEQLRERFVVGSLDLSVAELFLYVMRHVQHHAAQLNLILRQTTDTAPHWVKRAAPLENGRLSDNG
ncbi:MAG: DinB family protein [Ignavibacteriae bacterium]|nr:DinB family protein [Ignavibacteriota bacterium]